MHYTSQETSATHGLARREFLRQTTLATAFAAVGAGTVVTASSAAPCPPVAVFSKVFQTLKLDFEAAAALTEEAGLEGIDCPVRPNGEVLPEHVAEKLPLYAAALRRHKRQLSLLTTAITATSSPHTETILRTAKQLGVRFYRLGFLERRANDARQLAEIKAQFKELAAMNRELGVTALLQNHSPSGHAYVAGDLGEMFDILQNSQPAEIGAAFDIGHALVVHGEQWRAHFNRLKPYLKIAYVKDVKRPASWVPFGQGELAGSGYFKLLMQMGYQEPVSLHIEYPWSPAGRAPTRADLLIALKESSSVLRQWMTGA